MFFMVRQFGGSVCTPATWTLRTAAAIREWFAVAFGGGLFAAVANATGAFDTQMAMTSSDGITWTLRTTPSTPSTGGMEWTAITYGNGRFVAVASNGDDNRTMSSTDGTTWNLDTSGSTGNQWFGVTYDATNTSFIAVSANNTNRCITSTDDGATWTHRAIQSQGWRAVHANAGVTIAVGDAGAVSKSTDGGVNWTAKTAAASNDWAAVTYHSSSSRWVAVSTTGTGNRVMTSDDDGDNWTSRTSAGDNQWRAIVSGSGVLVAVCSEGAGQDLMTSDDGITWTLRTSAKEQNWDGIAFGADTFVAVSVNNHVDDATNLLRVMTAGCS